ncbi:MAG: glycosyltransferase family 2 protein [Chloroflexi bacterium]|nr:glycosyltransferase family 2 protein [Chloroflexota bacterium]
MLGTLPSVTIIILNWNGLADTLACLESLAHLDNADACEILVVDNGSTDGSPPVIRERFPSVTLIEVEENLGFTGGNNVGMQWALERGSDYALLLNNDTEVAPDFLRLLVEAAEADSQVGIVGPTIYYYEEPQTVWSAGGKIDWRRGATWMVGLDERDTGQFGESPREMDFCTGCALLIKRDVLQRVGLLDDRFFTYYEETEWCVRARRAGFKIVHVPTAKMWHKIPLDARESSPLVHYYMTRNRLLFLSAARAGLRPWFYTLVGEYLRTLLSWTLLPKWRLKRPLRRVMVRAIADAGRGQWGQVSIAPGNGG